MLGDRVTLTGPSLPRLQENQAAQRKSSPSPAAEESKGWIPAGANGKAPPASDGFAAQGRTYRIVKGDTLSAIGKRFGVPYKRIAAANGIKGPEYKIYAGRTLVIPASAAPRIAAVAPTSGDLETQASAAEQAVMADAKAYPDNPTPAAWSKLQTDFARWKGTIDALTGQGAFDSPAVKEFASKTEAAAVLQQNLPPGTSGLTGKAYQQAALGGAQRVFYQPADVVASNPLLGVPPLVTPPSIGRKPTTTTTVDGKQVQVRKDVAVIFVPGIARTEDDFRAQRDAALASGFLPLVADTGTFADPDQNSQAITAAIAQAKKQLGNPNAKVVLVGFSQGASDVMNLMRDSHGQYTDARKDVLAIHTVDSAAGGSHLADLALTVAQYMTSGQALSAKQKQLMAAFEQAVGADTHLPPVAVADGLAAIKEGIKLSTDVLQEADKVASPVLKKLGMSGLPGEVLGKVLLEAALTGRDLTQELGEHGGPAGDWIARLLYPAWNMVLAPGPQKLLGQGKLGELWDGWIQGGLGSLTPEYGAALLADPKLAEHLKGVPVLNASGAVSPDRANDLLAPSQRLPYDFFNALGLQSDSWVALSGQEAVGSLPTATQLAPAAIAHWGAQGVMYADASESNFASYSPGGWMKALLATDAALGIV